MNFEEWKEQMIAQRNGNTSEIYNADAVVGKKDDVTKYEGVLKKEYRFDIMLSNNWQQFNMYKEGDTENPVVSFTPQTTPAYDDYFKLEYNCYYILSVVYPSENIDPILYLDFRMYIDEQDDLIILMDNMFIKCSIGFNFSLVYDEHDDLAERSSYIRPNQDFIDAIDGNLNELNYSLHQYAIDNTMHYYFSISKSNGYVELSIKDTLDDSVTCTSKYSISSQDHYWNFYDDDNDRLTFDLVDLRGLVFKSDDINVTMLYLDYARNISGNLKDKVINVLCY